MQLEERPLGDILVLTVHSRRLDNYVAGDFKAGVSQRVAAGHGRLIIDLAEVTFIDSSGLGALVACLKLLGDPRHMALCGVSAQVMSLFKLTRMDQVFAIHADADAAAGALRG